MTNPIVCAPNDPFGAITQQHPPRHLRKQEPDFRGLLNHTQKTAMAVATAATLSLVPSLHVSDATVTDDHAMIQMAAGVTEGYGVESSESSHTISPKALLMERLDELFRCSNLSEEEVLRNAVLDVVRKHPHQSAAFALGDEEIVDLRMIAASIVVQVHVERLQRGDRSLSNSFGRLVKHDDPAIREGVVSGLGNVDGANVEPVIALFLKDDDEFVREAAAEELEARKEFV